MILLIEGLLQEASRMCLIIDTADEYCETPLTSGGGNACRGLSVGTLRGADWLHAVMIGAILDRSSPTSGARGALCGGEQPAICNDSARTTPWARYSPVVFGVEPKQSAGTSLAAARALQPGARRRSASSFPVNRRSTGRRTIASSRSCGDRSS